MIPADIPDRLLVTKTRRKLDPVKQLTQAGYPFNHIGTELVEIQGKFEIVSKDVALLKSEFKTLQDNIEKKIDKETSTISEAISGIPEKIDNKMRSTFAEQFGLHFDQRMLRVYGGGHHACNLGCWYVQTNSCLGAFLSPRLFVDRPSSNLRARHLAFSTQSALTLR